MSSSCTNHALLVSTVTLGVDVVFLHQPRTASLEATGVYDAIKLK